MCLHLFQILFNLVGDERMDMPCIIQSNHNQDFKNTDDGNYDGFCSSFV